MIEEAMVSTPEVCTNNSPMTPNPYMSTKTTSARKALYQFTETLYVKKKTDVRRFGEAEENSKAIKKGNALCSHIEKHCGHTKKPKGQRGYLTLDSTSSSGCTIYNYKWLYLYLY